MAALRLAEPDAVPAPLAAPVWPVAPEGRGRVVAFVGAHGGAGTTTAALTVAADADRGVCLVDADLAGGETAERLDLPGPPGDAGLAGAGDPSAAWAVLARRAPFGTLAVACPRPDLAWLIRDGAVRALVAEARRAAALVVVDAGRPLGPACEAVAEADLVVLVWHAHRPDAAERARRRIERLGVEALRIADCPTAPTFLERFAGRLRGAGPAFDLDDPEELRLLVEGRLASLPPRGGA
ncbi:MAG: hypothetical protein ACKOSO_06260 [Actinomycetota bacterium]